MNTAAWYFLQLEDDDETLYRCNPTGFESVPLRPLDMDTRPESATPAVQAAVSRSHSPYAPGSAGKMADDAQPRATKVVDDPMTTDDPTERYLRQLSHSVQEAVAEKPAPLYIVADARIASMFEVVAKSDVRGVLHTPHESPSALWSETRQREAVQ